MALIEVSQISKRYQLITGKNNNLLLRDSLCQWIRDPVGFLRGNSEDFWALKDITFKLDEGDVLGIIGLNGAGKSTLLKVLSRVTEPTSGQAVMRGRISSLLEVGTGFHPELTGSENIYLNGSILGMSKEDIDKHYDDIVEFSGVAKFIHTPVKRYSSGMQVRLGFSVAAHLKSEILLIDEVLAVGDMEFRRKCIDKMEKVTRDSGRGIIIVGHNMEMIQRLCNKCILLSGGIIKCFGNTQEAIKEYISEVENLSRNDFSERKDRQGNGSIWFNSLTALNMNGSDVIRSGDKIKFICDYESIYDKPLEDIRFYINIFNESGMLLARFDNTISGKSETSFMPKGRIICETNEVNLGEGKYFCGIGLHENGVLQDKITNACTFDLIDNRTKYNLTKKGKNQPPVLISHYFFQDKQ